jgi:hypothetical protein
MSPFLRTFLILLGLVALALSLGGESISGHPGFGPTQGGVLAIGVILLAVGCLKRSKPAA